MSWPPSSPFLKEGEYDFVHPLRSLHSASPSLREGEGAPSLRENRGSAMRTDADELVGVDIAGFDMEP